MMRPEEALTLVLAGVDRLSGLSDEALAQALRSEFPGLLFSVCDDDELSPRLLFVAENAACRLYYVSSAGHCLQLTNDATAASGFLVARRVDDDD